MSQRLLTVLTVALMFIGSAGLVGCEAGSLVGEMGDLLPGEYGAKAKQAERMAREAEDVQDEVDGLELFADNSDENGTSVSNTANTSTVSEFATDEAAVQALNDDGMDITASQFQEVKRRLNNKLREADQPELRDPELRNKVYELAQNQLDK
ncbi:MAG: hypothetical protein WDZ82_03755 [Candidatus Paceibacterota bacterium]